MANLNKLYKAFDAFSNHDLETSKKMFRGFFIESAREINQRMEKQLNEEFGQEPEDDLFDEISADEGEDESTDEDLFGADEDTDEFEDEDEEGTYVPADDWAEIQDKVDELEALFKELGGDAVTDEDDSLFDEEDEGDVLEFGDEDDEYDDEGNLKEGYELKKVQVPEMHRETNVDNTTSPVAGNAVSPVGVKATDGWTKDGVVKGSNVKLDTPDAETAKVEDNNNVQPNGKGIYRTSNAKATTKESGEVNTKSPIGKRR